MSKPIAGGQFDNRLSEKVAMLTRALRKAENDNQRLEDELAEARYIIKKQAYHIKNLEKRLK